MKRGRDGEGCCKVSPAPSRQTRGAGREPRIGKPRFRFATIVVSPARRALLRSGREVPLIPRYFDLLVLLLERRGTAVSRREMLDAVWTDVVVSDGALNQAVRILRRALGDDPRAPVYIKTVSRHGYRFIYPDVVEEPDDLDPATTATTSDVSEPPTTADPSGETGPATTLESGLALLLDGSSPSSPDDGASDAARRDAAEALHGLGTGEALRRLERFRDHPRYAVALAYLRDARWDVPDAGAVPLMGRARGLAALCALVGLRLRRAWRQAGRRWISSIEGGALAGIGAGFVGGLVLRFGPGSTATASVLLALPLFGAVVGGLGAAGVGAGLATAEVSIRSFRRSAIVVFGMVGGGAVGAGAHLVGLAVLQGLFGRDLSPLGGGFEGLALGGAAGLGYALSTPTTEGGMATPRGSARLVAVVATGAACGVVAAMLGAAGRYLGAMSLDFLSHSFPGSQVGLDPFARLLGEATPGPVTKVGISAFEGLMFGTGLALGITRRPR